MKNTSSDKIKKVPPACKNVVHKNIDAAASDRTHVYYGPWRPKFCSCFLLHAAPAVPAVPLVCVGLAQTNVVPYFAVYVRTRHTPVLLKGVLPFALFPHDGAAACYTERVHTILLYNIFGLRSGRPREYDNICFYAD